jgi:hypothetical protein
VIQEKPRKRSIDAGRKTKYIRYSKRAILSATCVRGGKRARKEARGKGKRTDGMVGSRHWVGRTSKRPSKQTNKKEERLRDKKADVVVEINK